jgi:hypothetical protein
MDREHAVSDPPDCMCMGDDVLLLVHAGAVVADMTLDRDRDRHVDTSRDLMPAAWIENVPMGFVGV